MKVDQFRNNLLTEKLGENHNKKSAIKKISQKILPHNYENDENKSAKENELQNQRINRIEMINKTKINPLENTDSRENEIDNIRNSKRKSKVREKISKMSVSRNQIQNLNVNNRNF